MSSANFEKESHRFLKKTKTTSFVYQWVALGSVTGAFNLETAPGFYSKGWLKKRAGFLVDEIPGALAMKFPAVDPYDCVPGHEKFFKLRKMQGYGIGKFKYEPYEGKKREIVRKEFDVFFPVNSTEPDAIGMQVVKDFLQQNHFEILKARLEGGCSVEGDSIRNTTLQIGRAKVLARSLKNFNNSVVKKDEVLLVDSWTSFRTLLAKSDFKDLDTLSDADLAIKIRRQESVRKKLEPIFVLQRKASLRLSIAKVFTHDERIIKLQSELDGLVSKLSIASEQSSTHEAKVMGILSYLFDLFQEAEISEQQFNQILADTGMGDYLNVLLGYHIMKQFEEQRYPKSFPTWKEYWNKHDLQSWFTKGQQSLLTLAGNAFERKLIIKLRKMLVDYQAYSFRFIQSDLMDINSLCQVSYPYLPAFRSLQLFQFGFLYEMAGQGKKINCLSVNESTAKTSPKDTFNADAFIDKIRKELGIKKSSTVITRNGMRFTKPSFSTELKTVYYTMLKEKFVLGHTDVLDNFEYVDDEGAVALNAFNLYHLLRLTINEWDPMKRYYYDKDVQFNEIGSLVGMMKKMDGQICTPQINQLYLDYHLKSLYYLERYFEPGDKLQAKVAEYSMKYVTEYYKSRVKALTPALSLHIVKQLNLFNWLPGPRCGAVSGYEILKQVAKQRVLNEEEMKLYAHYTRLYDPSLRNSLSPLLEKEKIVQLGREPYRIVKLTARR